MFGIGINRLQKGKITYIQDETKFKDEQDSFSFEDITSIYHRETRNFTNSTYTGTDLMLALGINNEEKLYRIHTNSNNEKEYKTIYKLSHEIFKYTDDTLNKIYEITNKIEFQTFETSNIIIELNQNEITLKYIGDKSHYKDFKVTQIHYDSYDNNGIIFIGENRKETIHISNISNKGLFLKLVNEIIPIEQQPQTYFSELYEKAKSILWKIYLVYITIMGGSALLHTFCCEFIPINGYSRFAIILLIFHILMTLIMKYLVIPNNDKKMQKEIDNITKDKE